MHHGSRIKFQDVIRFLKNKYGFLMDTQRFHNRIKRPESKCSPKELDCNDRIHRVMDLRKLDVESPSYLTKRYDSALQYVCSGLSEWRRDCESFGIPGICIDWKANANEYSIILVKLSARTDDSHERTILMDFISDEAYEMFVRLLKGFKSFGGVDPSMVALDQQAACMQGCRIVFPMAYLTLDD